MCYTLFFKLPGFVISFMLGPVTLPLTVTKTIFVFKKCMFLVDQKLKGKSDWNFVGNFGLFMII